MKQHDVIRMAIEAGLKFYEFTWTSPTNENLYPEGVYQEALEAFAKLVAEHEREACAKVCDERDDDYGTFTAGDCAEAIRARGEQS